MPQLVPVSSCRVPSLTRGGVSDPNKDKYGLDYYINLARDFSDMGVHFLAVTYMSGLLIYYAFTILILALRE